jgi:hypothetical protein
MFSADERKKRFTKVYFGLNGGSGSKVRPPNWRSNLEVTIMTDIITTKDLTKNELSGAKLLAAFVILGGLALFLNSAQMDQKDIPEVAFMTAPSQATDGSGLVNFGASISKLSAYDLKLKLEYTLDGENYSALNLSQAVIDSGSIDFNPGREFQVSNIVTESENVNLSFVWDTQSDPELKQISSNAKIRINVFYKLKEAVAGSDSAEIIPAENSDVEISASEVSIDNGVIIESNEPAADQPESLAATIIDSALPQTPEAINSVVAAFVDAVKTEAASIPVDANNEAPLAEEIWLEKPIISENFKLDNQSPKIISGILDVKARKLNITFSEPMDTEKIPELSKIVIQNSDASVNYNLIKSNYSWSGSDTLSLEISLSNIDIAFLTLDEAFQSLLVDAKFQAEAGSNLADLMGNEVFDSSAISLPQVEPEADKTDKQKEKKDEEKKEIIIPPNNKIINTRGYNQNCSFDPDNLIMSAGRPNRVCLVWLDVILRQRIF